MTRIDRVRNVDVREAVNQEEVMEKVRRKQRAWKEKLEQMEDGRLVKQVFRVKKLMGRRGAPELELLAVVIVLFAPILHESLTNSNFVTNTI